MERVLAGQRDELCAAVRMKVILTDGALILRASFGLTNFWLGSDGLCLGLNLAATLFSAFLTLIVPVNSVFPFQKHQHLSGSCIGENLFQCIAPQLAAFCQHTSLFERLYLFSTLVIEWYTKISMSMNCRRAVATEASTTVILDGTLGGSSFGKYDLAFSAYLSF